MWIFQGGVYSQSKGRAKFQEDDHEPIEILFGLYGMETRPVMNDLRPTLIITGPEIRRYRFADMHACHSMFSRLLDTRTDDEHREQMLAVLIVMEAL